jgi:myosin I
MFGLQGPESYAYTSRSNCLEVQGIDDVADFRETLVRWRITLKFNILLIIVYFQKAMNIIGLSQQEQTEILRMLAIILWLGNVQFSELEDGNARVDDTGVTDFLAYLMEADEAQVAKVMTSKVVETQRGGRRGVSCLEFLPILPLTPCQDRYMTSP